MKKNICMLMWMLVLIIIFVSACDKSMLPQSTPIVCYFEGEKCHSWINATCTESKYCRLCKLTEGEPNGHATEYGVCEKCDELIIPEDKIGIIYDHYSFITELSKRVDISSYAEKVYTDRETNTDRYTYTSSEKNYIGKITFSGAEIILPCSIADMWDVGFGVRTADYIADNNPSPARIHTFQMRNIDSRKFLTAYGEGPKNEYDKIIAEKISLNYLFFNENYHIKYRNGVCELNISDTITEKSSLDEILSSLGKPYTIKYIPYNGYCLIELTYPIDSKNDQEAWLKLTIYGFSKDLVERYNNINLISKVEYYID